MGNCISKKENKLALNHTLSISLKHRDTIQQINELGTLKILDKIEIDNISKKLIYKALSKNPIFKDLEEKDIEMFYQKFRMCVVEKDEYIFKQNDPGSLFFIINSGMVDVICNGIKKKTLKKEDSFGHWALISDLIRRASIKTITKSTFWVISRANFFKVSKRIFSKSYDQTRKILLSLGFLSKIPEKNKDSLAKIAVLHKFSNSDIIIDEGDTENLLYILKSGCVMFKKNGKELSRITNEGEIFGEGAMLTGCARYASAVCMGNTEVISIDESSLKKIFGDGYKEFLLKNISKHSIICDPHLTFLNKIDVINLVDQLTWNEYKEETIIIEPNTRIDNLIVICSGELVSKSGSIVKSYQVIGLGNINEKNLLREEYVTRGMCIIGQIPNSTIGNIIGTDINELFSELDKIKFFKKVSIFKEFSVESLKKLSKNIRESCYSKLELIFTKGNSANCLFAVKSGSVEIVKGKKILRIVKAHDTFGERCLIDKERTATARASENTTVYIIEKRMILKLPDQELNLLYKDIERRRYYQAELKLEELYIKYESPSRNHRKKYCIKSIKNGNKFDLTVIPKYSLETKLDCFSLVSEKEILIQLDHYLILNLVASMNDQFNVYFITEHLDSGRYLSEIKNFEEANLKILVFYLCLILGYLHDKDIVYRDLCPDNILLDNDKYPYLYSFRNAKTIKNRSYTRVGNPFYQSPEMILGRGYTKSTDYWSLGVIIYELVHGTLPFSMQYTDAPALAYEKIINVKHHVNDIQNQDLNYLILNLLAPSDKRLDLQGIKMSSWMASIPWKVLEQKKIQINNKKKSHGSNNTEKVRMKIKSISLVRFIQGHSSYILKPEVESFNWDQYF
jgi:CRP-like cAMP-binding protein